MIKKLILIVLKYMMETLQMAKKKEKEKLNIKMEISMREISRII